MRIAYLALVILGLAACTRQADVARHTVDEYRADKTLRQDVFKKCANDPGTLERRPIATARRRVGGWRASDHSGIPDRLGLMIRRNLKHGILRRIQYLAERNPRAVHRR